MTMPSTRRRVPRAVETDRRRASWQEFRFAYPGILATMGIAMLTMVGVDMWLAYNRYRYQQEITRLRSSMSSVERQKADVVLAAGEKRFDVMLALIRRQSLGDEALHLGIAVDSGVMYLEREGARLREMPMQAGPEKTVGTPPDTVRMVMPRGMRSVERIIENGESWEVPAWVYADRGLAAPADRNVQGALGPVAIVLSGGTVIYSPPTAGPLNDQSYILPGSIRARAEDLRAIAPNLKPGMNVYFY
jgi:hypothetical protein